VLAPGLDNAAAEIGAEFRQMGAHGAHELAAALFNGSPFVMYPRGTKDDHGVHGPEHGLDAKEMEQPQQEHDRGRDR